jgi:hypothetical protein
MTQTEKPTPGPWHVAARNGDITRILDYPGRLVAEVRGATGSKSEMKANARLIAAAPELLAVLKLVLDHDGKLTGADWTHLRAAIAKAEGKQP